MAKSATSPEALRIEAIAQAKRLMRVSRTAALATLDPESGAPLATLVGVVSDFDGAPLFLMSTLSRHTRHLQRDPRASALLSEPPARGDPLNHPRVTLTGRISPDDRPNARARYLQRYPKARLYAGFADFGVFRLDVESVHFNGGFGRAQPLEPSDVLAPREGESALIEAEPRLLQEINARGDAYVAALAGFTPSARRVWRGIGLDSEGLDLSSGSRAGRLQFASAARDEASWRAQLEATCGERSNRRRSD